MRSTSAISINKVGQADRDDAFIRLKPLANLAMYTKRVEPVNVADDVEVVSTIRCPLSFPRYLTRDGPKPSQRRISCDE
jgi:hypothetical protein